MKSLFKLTPFSLLMSWVFLLSSCGEKPTPASESPTTPTTPASETNTKVLMISAIPDKKISDQAAAYKALAEYLEKTLGVTVKYDVSSDYTVAVQRFANDEVHLMWFGGVTGAQARAKVEGARAIAQGVIDPQYKSYFIAHKSTGLAKSDAFPMGIADFSFTFGSKNSTSGRVMPAYFIQKETGKTPEDFFKEAPQFQLKGSHEATAMAVNAGSVKVGVLNYKTFDTMKADGQLPDCDIIWETPGYADYNFTAHPSLEKTFGEGFIDKLQKVLVDCKEKAALAAIMREEGLIPAKNEDFADLEKVSLELGFLK
jgi:phosphonate transport system substrate-binding protein